MTQQHDFKAALEDFKSIESDINMMKSLTHTSQPAYIDGSIEVSTYKAIQAALRMADRVQSGEVSEDMREEGYAANIGPAGTFKAMPAQLTKEVMEGESDGKNR